MRASSWYSGFGVFLRGSGRREPDGYVAGTDRDAAIVSPAGGSRLVSIPFEPGNGWHTYRFEAKGNVLRLVVDGAPRLETMDNRFLRGGQMGLWVDSVQINVRRFRVIAL